MAAALAAVEALPQAVETALAPEPDLVALLGLEDMPLLMSPKVLSEQTEISVATLSRWRQTWPKGERQGPAFFEPEGTNMIRYARKDFAAWLFAGSVAPKEVSA